MRLFFAAFPDEELRRSIGAASEALELAPESKVSSAENYHMTLLFLGNVAESELKAVREIGEVRAARHGHFPILFDRWEYWQASRAVVVSSAKVPQPLASLRDRLVSALTIARRRL